jgi:hypothetical protein
MGIVGDKPRQLVPTMGTMGSGSTDSPPPSPTNAKINIDPAIDTTVGIAVPTDADTNAKIDIDPTIDTSVGIAVPIYTDTNTDVSIDTAPSSVAKLVPTVTIVGPTLGATGAVSAITGGFDMAFGCSASTWMTTELSS